MSAVLIFCILPLFTRLPVFELHFWSYNCYLRSIELECLRKIWGYLFHTWVYKYISAWTSPHIKVCLWKIHPCIKSCFYLCFSLSQRCVIMSRCMCLNPYSTLFPWIPVSAFTYFTFSSLKLTPAFIVQYLCSPSPQGS